MSRSLAALSLSAGLAATASAAPLVTFDFFADNPDEGARYRGGSTGVGALDVRLVEGLLTGDGLSPLGGDNEYNANDFIDAGDAGTLAEAIAQDEFLTFTVGTASDDTVLDLAGGSLDLNMLTVLGGGANRFERLTLFTSIDGFLEPAAVSSVTVPGGTNTAVIPIPDLPAFEDLSEDVELRVLFSRDSAATNTGGGFRFVATSDPLDPGSNATIVLNGEINPVPEPASLALLGLGSLLIAGRRRG